MRPRDRALSGGRVRRGRALLPVRDEAALNQHWRNLRRAARVQLTRAETAAAFDTLTILIFSTISAFLILHRGHNSSSERSHAELGHQQKPFPSQYMAHFSSIMNLQLSDFGSCFRAEQSDE